LKVLKWKNLKSVGKTKAVSGSAQMAPGRPAAALEGTPTEHYLSVSLFTARHGKKSLKR